MTITGIRVVKLTDGRAMAHFAHNGPATHPEAVGAESSGHGLSVGRDPEAEAVENLRRLYPDLPSDLPVFRA